VIALGRLLFAAMFLTTIWIDVSQPGQLPRDAYSILFGYTVVAVVLAAASWNSWWLDTQLAGFGHAVDIAVFTIMVRLTMGDPSPYFLLCIFALLSAAIRWGWRATALTAVLLTLLYLLAGSLAPTGAVPKLASDRYLARTGYLVIISLMLIWFGVNQWRAGGGGGAEELLFEDLSDNRPLENSLLSAMAEAKAKRGVLAWSRRPTARPIALFASNGSMEERELSFMRVGFDEITPFLYDMRRKRALVRDANRNLRSFDPDKRIGDEAVVALELNEGLAIPVMTERGQGCLYLEGIRGLSADHLEVGEGISQAVRSHLHRRALLKVAEENAEARSRLAIARDLHDSVVQFLAGAAFRLEAMKRNEDPGRDLTPELDELKLLMLQEQSELRTFISALRSGSHMELAELAKDLQSLSSRLSRQWGVQCSFSMDASDATITARLHLDAQQLVREAVANAVRHAGATTVSIRLSVEADNVRLDFINDGSVFPKTEDGDRMPISLKERVEAAGGTLDLSRGMGVTKISVSLPMVGKVT
jgi:signal transduction histidine kinase